MSMTLGDVFVFLKGDKSHLDKTIDSAEQKAKSFAGGVANSLNNAFSFALGGFIQQGLNNIALGIQNVGIRAFDAVASNESLRLSLESLAASQIRAADSNISMNDAMAAATPLAKEMQEWITRVAVLSPFSQDTIAKSVQMAQGFKFNSVAAKELIQTLTDSTAATGRSGAAMEQATRAIGQMNLAGVVHKEELNQLSEAGIDYVRILDQMGVTLDDVSKGTVSADDFIRTLIDTLQGDFAGAAERQATSWAGLKSTFQDIINIGLRNFFEGILEPLQPLAQKLTDTFSNEAVLEGMRQMGRFIGDLIAPAAEFLAEKLDKLPAIIERVSNFIRQLRDELAGLTAGDILAGLEPGLAKMQSDLNTTLDTLAKAHQGTLDQLQADISTAGEKVGQKMVEVGEKYGPKIAELEERIAETAAGFQERLTDMAEAHAKRRAEIEDQITKNTAKLEEKLTELKRDHQRRRQQLVTSLLTAESEEQYLQIQSQIKAEDDKYKEQVDKTKAASAEQKTELEKRLKEEDVAYKKQETRTKRDRDKALADIQEQLNKVSAERAKAEGEVQAAYQAEVDALNNKIAQENAAYEQQQADLKASFAQQMEEFKADTLARAEAIGTGLAGRVGDWLNGIAAAYKEGGILAVIELLIGDIIAADAKILAALGEWAVSFWGWLTGEGGVLSNAAGVVGQAVTTISNLFVENWPLIQAKLSEWSNRFWDWLLGENGALSRVNEAMDNVTLRIQAWLEQDTTRDAIRGLGGMLANHIIDGIIASFTGEEEDKSSLLAQGLLLTITNAFVNLEGLLVETWTQFVFGMITAIYERITGEEVPPRIAEALEKSIKLALLILTPAAWFSPVGEGMIDGIIDGMEKAKEKLKASLSGVLQWSLGKAKDAIGAHSPSTLWADEVGKPSAQGIGVGFSEGMKEVMSKASSLLSKDMIGSLRPALSPAMVTLQQTNYLPQAPAGFDAEGLMNEIDGRTSRLLLEFVQGLKS